jgi:Fur family peroxide stress response transcriptional regulator
MSTPQKRLDELTAKLKTRGYRLTPQRIAILKILVASTGHPSVEQIYENVKVDFPTTSLATVYKTVALLKEMGEILELGFGTEGNRYDGNKPYPHPHLICVKCKSIFDPDISGLSQLPQQVAQMTGFQIRGHRLDFYGICPQCQGSEPAGENPTRSIT